jgi:hypothetical protein
VHEEIGAVDIVRHRDEMPCERVSKGNSVGGLAVLVRAAVPPSYDNFKILVALDSMSHKESH